jgi:hypothetical protein
MKIRAGNDEESRSIVSHCQRLHSHLINITSGGCELTLFWNRDHGSKVFEINEQSGVSDPNNVTTTVLKKTRVAAGGERYCQLRTGDQHDYLPSM